MSEQPTEIEQAAQRFVQMHDRLLKNVSETFGGAVVIVPPKNAGENIELLMLDSQGDPAQFWSTINTRITIILDGIKEKERVTGAFGRR